MLDVLAVPDGLEQPVGETEGEDVLGGFLPRKWSIPKDLILGEDLVHGGIQLSGARQVGAEGLLHDDREYYHDAGSSEEMHDRESRQREGC